MAGDAVSAQYKQYKAEYDAYNDFITALGQSQDAVAQAQIAMEPNCAIWQQPVWDTMKRTIDGLDEAQEEAEDQLEDTYTTTKKQLDKHETRLL